MAGRVIKGMISTSENEVNVAMIKRSLLSLYLHFTINEYNKTSLIHNVAWLVLLNTVMLLDFHFHLPCSMVVIRV